MPPFHVMPYTLFHAEMPHESAVTPVLDKMQITVE